MNRRQTESKRTCSICRGAMEEDQGQLNADHACMKSAECEHSRLIVNSIDIMNVRFINLVYLKKDMEKKGWIIDSFPFSYNGVNTIVVITLYKDGERKPTENTVARVCFVLRSDASVDLNATADLWNVRFNSVSEFCDFWHIQYQNQGRLLFEDFSSYFAKYIPQEKTVYKQDEIERRILGGRVDGNDPLAIYCMDVRRNGRRSDGTPNQRSIENSNKAETLRPKLFHRFRADMNLSFFFSKDPNEEKTDEKILRQYASSSNSVG